MKALWTCGNLTAKEHTHSGTGTDWHSWCLCAFGSTGLSHKNRPWTFFQEGTLTIEAKDNAVGGDSSMCVCVWARLGSQVSHNCQILFLAWQESLGSLVCFLNLRS